MITNVQKKVPPGQKVVENMNFFFGVTIFFQGKCGIGPKLENIDFDVEWSWSCLVPRRLSFHENVRAKEGGKKTTRLYPSHGPLRFITSHSFRSRLCHAKNEAPEEEADHDHNYKQRRRHINKELSS